MWNFMFFFNSALLGVGLAMDAFSVSMADGLSEPEMKKKKGLLIALVFGMFQGFMPFAGWFFVHSFVQYFNAFQRFIPYIALILLLFIGGKMLLDSRKNEEVEARRLIAEAEAAAAAHSEQLLRAEREECERMKAEARSRLDAAAALIVEKVVND